MGAAGSNRRGAPLAAAALLFCGSLAAAASARMAGSPAQRARCPTRAAVRAALHAVALAPTTGALAAFGQTVDTCTYGTLVEIGFARPATGRAFAAELARYRQENPSTRTVAGVGGGAFSYAIAGGSASCGVAVRRCGAAPAPSAPDEFLTVLDAGTAIVEIAALRASVTTAEEVALYRSITAAAGSRRQPSAA